VKEQRSAKPTHTQPWKSGAFSAASSAPKTIGLQPQWTSSADATSAPSRQEFGSAATGKATTSVAPLAPQKTFVIPNRAEGPVRNLLFSRHHQEPRVPP